MAGAFALGITMSWQQQAHWSSLPGSAKAQAYRLFPRSRRPIGQGDQWLYRYSIQDPPSGYGGPVPFRILHSRVKG